MTQQKRDKKAKYKKVSLTPGDNVALPEDQLEYLKLSRKFISNPQMETILLTDHTPNGDRMNFGHNPLPWETPMTAQEFTHLKEAQEKLYVCNNEECAACGQEVTAEYYLTTHKRELQHSNSGNQEIDLVQNKLNLNFFGKRENLCTHVAVRCKTCKKHIKYVSRSLAHRRAAKDPMVSGPHQRYGSRPTY